MITPEEEKRREAIYDYNGQIIEKLKSGKFSWDDYKDAFRKALEFMIIKRIGTDEAKELEKKGETILWIGKKGEPKRPFMYIGPPTAPGEKKAPERFLYDGLCGPLKKVAGAHARKEFKEAKGRKREMADYFFGEIQDRIIKGDLDWKAYGDILKKAEGFGGILKEISAPEFEKINNEYQNLRKEYSALKKKYSKAEGPEKKSLEEELIDIGAKKDLAIKPIKYVIGWKEGRPQEKFYTFAGSFEDRKRGTLESQIYDEISGPILESVQEAQWKRKEAKEKARKWYKEAKEYKEPVEKKIEKPKSPEERYLEQKNKLIEIENRIKGKQKKLKKLTRLSEEERLQKGWDPKEIQLSISNLEKEHQQLEKEILAIKDEISERIKAKLVSLDTLEPSQQGQKFREIFKEFLEYAYPKAIISKEDFQAWREKGEISTENLEILSPFIGKTPEIKEGQQVVEIKCKVDDVEPDIPFDQARVRFKKPVKIENLVIIAEK